jgi:hypothetical protein
MKKSLFIGVLLLTFAGIETFGSATAISNWRWRNDNGDEASAQWKAPEKDTIILDNQSNIRLRMQIICSAVDPISFDGILYYASLKDTVWHAVSEDASDAFIFSPSTGITNGSSTTHQLTLIDSYTAASGVMRETSGAFNISLSEYQSKEYEFCIKATSKAKSDEKYVFVIENSDWFDGVPGWSIESLPILEFQGSGPLAINPNKINANQLSVYPNPASELINISGIIPANSTAKIYKLNGSLILEQQMNSSTVDISKLDKGMYILEVNGSSFKFNKN